MSVSSCKLITAVLVVSMVVGCATDATDTPTDDTATEVSSSSVDDGSYRASLGAEPSDQTELASSGCVNDAGCPQGSMCVKTLFGPNYCAQLCSFDPLGHSNCPPGLKCTRPFPYTGRFRCTPD
jgi:hypothetical protein